MFERSEAYQIPYHAVEMIEPRFSIAKADRWTSVISDDWVFRKMLEAYFLFDFQYVPFFHKDLFLDDMAAGRQNFCSSLLVNAILARASVRAASFPRSSSLTFLSIATMEPRNRADFWDPTNLGYRFLAEAKRLLEFERKPWKITTIQATALIHFECNKCGIDKVGWSYIVRAIDMARDIKLFSRLAMKSSKECLARAVTAWGLFSHQA